MLKCGPQRGSRLAHPDRRKTVDKGEGGDARKEARTGHCLEKGSPQQVGMLNSGSQGEHPSDTGL